MVKVFFAVYNRMAYCLESTVWFKALPVVAHIGGLLINLMLLRHIQRRSGACGLLLSDCLVDHFIFREVLVEVALRLLLLLILLIRRWVRRQIVQLGLFGVTVLMNNWHRRSPHIVILVGELFYIYFTTRVGLLAGWN